LEQEIRIQKTPTFNVDVTWLMQLERLIKRAQQDGLEDRPTRQQYRQVLHEWRAERKDAHAKLKRAHNHQFGSVFRTHHNPSGFADIIRNHADLYTSKLENMAAYPLDHVFYPERVFLPHEHPIDTASAFLAPQGDLRRFDV
jgi:hypothetical protein